MWLDNLTTQLGVVDLLLKIAIFFGKNLPQYNNTEKRSYFYKFAITHA